MSRGQPDAVKLVPVEMGSRGPCWRVERWGGRYLFIGPEPGLALFTSLGAPGWDDAVMQARRRWNEMDSKRRATWYGPRGRFTHLGKDAAP